MKNKKWIIYVIASVVVIIDQIVKLVVKNTMDLYQIIIVIPNFFNFTYIKNTGAAFSFMKDKLSLLIIIGAICLGSLIYYIHKENNFNSLTIISIGIILGGVIGNFIDRIFCHGVIDYLSFKIFGYNFPIFNIADIGITVGIILFIIEVLFVEKGR